jgi:hypothetical protein
MMSGTIIVDPFGFIFFIFGFMVRHASYGVDHIICKRLYWDGTFLVTLGLLLMKFETLYVLFTVSCVCCFEQYLLFRKDSNKDNDDKDGYKQLKDPFKV